eukprot:1157066-Pelagomonas_calceolata.AAC.3
MNYSRLKRIIQALAWAITLELVRENLHSTLTRYWYYLKRGKRREDYAVHHGKGRILRKGP